MALLSTCYLMFLPWVTILLNESHYHCFSGIIYMNECPHQPVTPVYLIGIGFTWAITMLLLIGIALKLMMMTHDDDEMGYSVFGIVVLCCVALLTWIIAGRFTFLYPYRYRCNLA